MQKPTFGSGANKSDYWFSWIGDLSDVHDRAQPNNRAFYFLAQGASPQFDNAANSIFLPWGMPGIGNDAAARIWYLAMEFFIPGNADFKTVRNAVIQAAYILNPSWVAPARNAYAAINVGLVDASYPTPLAMTNPGWNTTQANAWWVPEGNGGPAGTVDFTHVNGYGASDYWYAIAVPPSTTIQIRLNPYQNDYDLYLFDYVSGAKLATSLNGPNQLDQVKYKAGPGGANLLLHVNAWWMKQAPYMFALDFEYY
jgi:hypothetical protein